MNITVQHLTSTGIGRTVNALRKDDGEIGRAAKALISKWKQMVASQESDGDDGEGNVDADVDEEEPQINYDYENENKIQTESIGDCEKKTHKSHEHLPKSSSSSSNNNNHHHQPESHHHHHHHHDQNHRHAHGKTSDNHNMNRKVTFGKKGLANGTK